MVRWRSRATLPGNVGGLVDIEIVQRDPNLSEWSPVPNYESAKNQDPTLYCAYFGGPRDGFKTGDLPATLTGKKLTGMVSKMPLSQPHYFSLYAVYLCTSGTQVNGFWEFHYIGMEGPNGEQITAAEPASAQA
jgi:hypothetical protein